ncbi:MAG TPA: hypothetical protein VIJ51_12075 [Solirubrobacteraceae bacterium]
MARLWLVLVVLAAVWCVPASAGVLVFQRPAVGDSAIVAARSSDGGAARVIGRGADPVVSPNGRRVAFIQPRASCPRALFAGQGCSRLLVADLDSDATTQVAPFAQPPIAWSTDSRYLASQDTNQNNAHTQVIRLRNRRRRIVPVAGSSPSDIVSITFSPDDAQVLTCDNYMGVLELSLAKTAAGGARSYGAVDDCWATWSRYGLAYTTTDSTRDDPTSYNNILLRPGLMGAARTLDRLGPTSDPSLAGWSASGELLAATADPGGLHAVVIDPRNDATTTTWTSAPGALGAAVDGISRNATRILLEQNNQILAADVATRAITVLATNAATASWND